MNVGENIRKIRKSKGKTMNELGKMIGISEQGIGNYERGERNPKIETLDKIAIALGVPLSDLLDSKESIDVTNDDVEFLDGFTFDNPEIFDVVRFLKGYNYIIKANPYEDTHLLSVYKDNNLLATVKKADFEEEATPLIKLANMAKNKADSFVDGLDFLGGFHIK